MSAEVAATKSEPRFPISYKTEPAAAPVAPASKEVASVAN